MPITTGSSTTSIVMWLGENAVTRPWVAAWYRNSSTNKDTTTDQQLSGTAGSTNAVTLIPGPAAGTSTLTSITLRNLDSITHTVIVGQNVSGTLTQIMTTFTMLAGDRLSYVNDTWIQTDQWGNPVQWYFGTQADGSVSVDQNILESVVPVGTAFATVASTSYFVYMGQVNQAGLVLNTVRGNVTSAAAGTVSVGVALCSTSLPPNGAGQTLTVLSFSTTLSALSSTGVFKNSTGLNYIPPVGTYLWAGFFANYGTTQPTVSALGLDYSAGRVLSKTGDTIFTTVGETHVGSLIADGASLTPDLRVTTF